MVLLALLGAALAARTAAGDPAAEDTEELSAGPVNPVELRAFVAGVLAEQQQVRPFAGCVVTVVRDGRVFLNQGYGYADREAGTPVHPERTLFRIGSISKVFVYLALQQQIAAGRLRLDTPIAAVLPGVSLDAGAVVGPDGAGEVPLTLRHLVTHTAGFDEQVVGLFSRDPAQVRPLAEQLGVGMPPRLRPAGIDASYSNHGTALAAHLVEIVSGQAYPAYLRTRLLQPLALHQTTLEQPAPRGLEAEPAIGYRTVGGALQPQLPEVVPLAPVGGMSSTGADMGRLMMALLQPDGRALPAAAVLAMRERLHVVDPRLPAMLFGLYERGLAPRSFGHGGDTIDFHADMRLYPDQDLGVFVACNSDGSARGISEFMGAFSAHYFPCRAPVAKAAPAELQAAIAGWYAPLRVSETTLGRLALLLEAMPLEFDAQGLLMLPTPAGSQRFTHVADTYFRSMEGDERLVFQRGEGGAVTKLWIGSAPMLVFAPVSLLDKPTLNLLWLGVALAILLGWLLGLPILRWRKRRTGGFVGRGSIAGTTRAAAMALWASAATLVLGVLLLAGLIASPDTVLFADLAALRWLLSLLLVGALLVVLSCVLVWRSRSRPRSWWWVLGALVAVLLWLGHWNLLGFHYPDIPASGAQMATNP